MTYEFFSPMGEIMRYKKAAMRSEELQAYGVIFTLNTGVRLGELIGLQWKDVNFQRHTVRIRRTAGRLSKVAEDGSLVAKSDIVKSTEIVVRTPKSITSRREIPMFDRLWNGLMEYRERQREMIESLGSDYDDQDYIFGTTMGKDPDFDTLCIKIRVLIWQITVNLI